jgi:hypothetical protein
MPSYSSDVSLKTNTNVAGVMFNKITLIITHAKERKRTDGADTGALTCLPLGSSNQI